MEGRVGCDGGIGSVVAFGLGCALFAFGLAMCCVEVSLKIGPGLVGCRRVEPSVTIVKVDSRVVDDCIGRINDLLVRECPISGLGIRLYLLDSAEEGLNGLVWIPLFVKALCVGS